MVHTEPHFLLTVDALSTSGAPLTLEHKVGKTSARHACPPPRAAGGRSRPLGAQLRSFGAKGLRHRDIVG